MLGGIVSYHEVISEYNPDIIVHIDGYNDLDYLAGSLSNKRKKTSSNDVVDSPYSWLEEKFLRSSIELFNYEQRQRSNLLFRLSFVRILQKLGHKFLSLLPPTEWLYSPTDEDLDLEEKIFARDLDVIKQRSAFLARILARYASTLQGQGTELIFILQPNLYEDKNKIFTPIEKNFRETCFIKTGHINIKKIFSYALSPALKKVSNLKGFKFVDVNSRLEEDKVDYDFYTDYCHLTLKGNIYMSDIIVESIEESGRLKSLSN